MALLTALILTDDDAFRTQTGDMLRSGTVPVTITTGAPGVTVRGGSTRKPASESARLRTRYIRFLVLDAACVTAAIIGTSLLYRGMPGWIEVEADRAPAVRLALLAGGALLALPFSGRATAPMKTDLRARVMPT